LRQDEVDDVDEAADGVDLAGERDAPGRDAAHRGGGAAFGELLQDDDLARGRYDAVLAGTAGEAFLRFAVQLHAAVPFDDDDVAFAILRHVHSLSAEGGGMLESRTMFLDARLRRLTTYLYVQDLLAGAHVLEVGSDGGNGDFLRSRGARSVGRVTPGGLGGLAAGEFDVAFALEADAAELRATVEALRRMVKPDGTVVVAMANRDRPGARANASYY